MGCFGSKDKLSKEDMDFLKTHTRYDESTIKEWYKGFKADSIKQWRSQTLTLCISLMRLISKKDRKVFYDRSSTNRGDIDDAWEIIYHVIEKHQEIREITDRKRSGGPPKGLTRTNLSNRPSGEI
ncbi:hypothetical protein Trydic_g16438 [Trypoxylus dichotomus]